MSAVLRISGALFDVDQYTPPHEWHILRTWRVGERRTRRGSKQHDSAGFNIAVGTSEMTDLAGQVIDAISFLTRFEVEIRHLVTRGPVVAVLDFAVNWRNSASHSDVLPAELVRAAAAAGIGLEISHYPIQDGE